MVAGNLPIYKAAPDLTVHLEQVGVVARQNEGWFNHTRSLA